MRIGVFEIDCIFQPFFVLVQVIGKQAKLLRAIHIRNVRGTKDDWLRLYVEIGGRRTRQKVVRNLGVGDEAAARTIEKSIADALLLPGDLGPGAYTARLLVNHAMGEEEMAFAFQVLPRGVIPTDFVRAPLLSAYISTDDALRAFAAKAAEGRIGLAPGDTLRLLYQALLERELSYQPVNLTSYPDCQEISPAGHALRSGGSCSDLSLLMASLLWCRGVSPALLLFSDHMAAGCFLEEKPPDFELAEGSGAVLSLIDRGRLAMVECTAMCRYLRADYDEAVNRLLDRLRTGSPCMLINVRKVLMNGSAVRLPDVSSSFLRCPCCGYDRVADSMADRIVCPACGEEFSPPPESLRESRPAPEESLTAYSARVRYGRSGNGAAVLGAQAGEGETIRVSPVWQGRAVRSVGSRAFALSGAGRVILPETVTRIGDYAFQGCVRLRQIAIPPDTAQIGTGAFAGSGLAAVRLPGGIKRISRLTFAGCAQLEKVELEEGIELIDERAFENCKSLKSVVIPSSVRQISRNAFDQSCELLLTTYQTIFI